MLPPSLRGVALIGSLVAGTLVPQLSGAVTLDIDSLPGMVNTPGAAVPLESQLSTQRLAQSVVVTSTGGFASVVEESGDTGTGWKRDDPTVKSGLGGTDGSGALEYSSPITFRFVSPLNGTSPLVIDSFSLYTDWYGDGSFVSLAGFDEAGNLVAQTSGNEHPGQALIGTKFSIAAPNIHRVVVQGSLTTAVSNIVFGEPVPEPASVMAMLTGMVALVRRRRGA